jgi:hypothetical protein
MDRRGQRQAFNCGNVTIGNNVLSDVGTNIHLDGVRGVTITGNTFWQGYNHNILVEDSSHVLLGANMLERNPLYSYTTAGKDNVVIRNSRDCTIQGLHLHNVIDSEAGLTIEKCQRVHIVGCTILDCDNVGLLVKGSNDIHWEANIIGDSRPDASALQLKVIDSDGKIIEERR